MREYRKYFWLLALMLTVVVTGCSGGGGHSTTLLTVISTYPAAGAYLTPLNSIISVTFSETMNPVSFTPAAFTVMHESSPVAGTISCTGATASFVPVNTLAPNTTFTATITPVALPAGSTTDLDDGLLKKYVWTFTTGPSPAQYILTRTIVNGSLTQTVGNVTVTSSPGQTTYAPGTVVTLTAVPATDYTFTGWSGDVNGLTNPDTITMTGDTAVTANFALTNPGDLHVTVIDSPTQPYYTLTVNAIHGRVTQSLSQVIYASSSVTMVTLTAVPDSGYTFTGWSGDLLGSANPASIAITGNKIITANF